MTMLQSFCRAGKIQPVKNGHHMFAVTAVVGLSGGLSGAISISTPEEAARKILQRMADIESERVDEFVRDAVGEVANVVGGKGKRDLSQYQLRLGLPQVIVGRDYAIFSPRWAQHYWIPLETALGPCTLDVGFDTHLQT